MVCGSGASTTNEQGLKIEGKYRVLFRSTYVKVFFFIFRKPPTLNYVNKE